MQVFGEWAQVEVIELVNDGTGLAFGIVGGRSSGVVIKSVLPGGVADRDGRLHTGDMLLRIGGVCVVGMCARQAAAVLRQCGVCVRLLVARPHLQVYNQSEGPSSSPVVPSRLLADPVKLERRLAEAGHVGFNTLADTGLAGFNTLADDNLDDPPPVIIEERLHHRPVASIVAVVPRGALTLAPRPPLPPPVQEYKPPPLRLPLDMAVRGSPETESYNVELNKHSALGLGITVAGYVCEQQELSGIFVKSVSEGSAADLSGQIQVNDRIIEVDGVSLHGVSNHRAVALLRDAKGPVVRLKALRYLRGAGFERLQRALAAQDGRPLVAPPSPSVTSLAKYSFSVYDESTVIEAEPESEFRHVPSPTSPSEEREIVIGGSHEREQDSRRIQDKWRDILRNEPDWPGHQYQHDIIVGIIIKDVSSGLGISLEGTVRVVRGRELQARHYIRAIAPGGPTDRTRLFQVGDELLEVNNWRVLGAHHVEVVSRLRAAASPVTLVAARLPQKKPLLTGAGVGGSLQALSARGLRGSRGGLVKAKSETSLCSTHTHNNTVTSSNQDNSELCSWALSRSRSRSLEPLSGLAMWSDNVEYISLVKEDRGLGFSILDYLDPMEAGASVVVVRSVVRGGAAAREGRLAPGDRLVSVNQQLVARAPLHVAVNALKSAPKGIVTLGISKPLPCSTVVGGQKPNGHSIHSSQECINSLASDDNTGLDSFHECLQEYGEGLEVVQICLEPEDGSIKDDELSVLGDLSTDSNKKHTITNVEDNKVNGLEELKSEASLEDQDDDMTITEDDVLVTPRDLPDRSKSSERKDNSQDRTLSKQQSKDISTSDEMVFAVTPTGLERISFDKYWKESDLKPNDKPRLEKVKSDESWKECLNSPADENIGYYDEATKISVQEENCSLLYIDHEVDGYETCLDDDSSSTKCTNSDARKPNGERDIKEERKQHKLALRNNDNDVSAKHDQRYTANSQEDFSNFGRPYVQEHIIKQMQSLKIEPINVNICNKKRKSPTKPSKSIRCVEYYNDQAECLEEIRQKKIELESHTDTKIPVNETQKKKLQIKKRETSEESTDPDTFVPGCHKCFLEKYAYEITKAYMDEAKNCKYCEVIREMLVVERGSSRRRSAPALARRVGGAAGVTGGSGGSTSDDDVLLTAPGRERDRRKSAGPLKFIASSPKPSSRSGRMTVSSVPGRREGPQRWGPARDVCLRRKPGGPLGVSIVGGKVDIISKEDGEGDEKAIFGIFIKNVVPDSPAAYSGELHAGDRILEVEGVCVRSAPHERAVQLIQRAGDTVTLTVQTLLAWNTDSSTDVDASPPPRTTKAAHRSPAPPPAVVDGTPQHEIKIMVTSEPEEKEDGREKDNGVERENEDVEEEGGEVEKKTVYSDSDSSDEEDERELQGRTYSEKGVEIDRASAGAVKRSKEEKEADKEEEDDYGYTTNKIRKKYSSLGDGVVVVKLERSARAGLGLALAGHRDRSRMAVFICGLNPAGAAAKANPAVKVGDEILEVNGIVLHGRCHLNASAIIKGLVGPVFKIILLRRKTALEDVAVKPLLHTQFPVELDDQADDRFANYKGVRDITVKKGPSGLGIMIIEGRHTEAGRGIFVSDLQEGSAAEQAGLQIGDMILAVNRDSLLSCSYDSAAAKLKQTEGVVVLTVCSPNLKEEGDSTAPATAAEPPPEPGVAPVVANQETVIEVASNNEPLGIVLLGGSDTQVNGAAAVILDIYKQGAIGKDGRLKVGDQILECNGIKITKEMAHERLCMSIKQKAPKLRMTVYRPEPLQYSELEVELARKPGRVLGLVCVTPNNNTHLYLGDMLSGSVAECDGRLARGDLLVSAAGQDLTPTADSNADTPTAGAEASAAAAAALRLASGKTTLKVKRYKILR